MAAFFEGFTRSQNNELLAMVRFTGTRHSLSAIDDQNRITRTATPATREAQYDEETFKKVFSGLGFDPLRNLPYREGGYSIPDLINTHQPKAVAPARAPNIAPSASTLS